MEISKVARWVILLVFLLLVIIILIKVRGSGDGIMNSICERTGGLLGC